LNVTFNISTAPRVSYLKGFAYLSCLAACAACSSAPKSSPNTTEELPTDAALTTSDVPLAKATSSELDDFATGDVLFDLPERSADGLGPLYTRDNCGSCHNNAARGPGFVQKMSVVEADGITAAADQSALAFGHTVHPLLVAPATTPIEPPSDDPSVRVTTRVGPPVLGRGYMEAVDDAEIERVAAAQAAAGGAIQGRINHVAYASEPNPDTRFFSYQKGDIVIGRFGVKARVATLDDFTADALNGDMGITSPLRPTEFPNPDGLLDDNKPGIDITADSVNGRAMYMRLLAIPKRAAGHDAGAALFTQVGCDGCHVPTLHTRQDYPIAALADIDAPIYTDLLLHDMGDALADGMADGVDGEAHSRDMRTAPLIGLRFNRTFLHDGRALSVTDAVTLHQSNGSEANAVIDAFLALSPDQQTELTDFVNSL
jgi:CxxC motif-containing protein (DUF1111 family)